VEPGQLLHAHGLEGVTVGEGPPGLHLHDDQRIAVVLSRTSPGTSTENDARATKYVRPSATYPTP
jgi:hypothetical protein